MIKARSDPHAMKTEAGVVAPLVGATSAQPNSPSKQVPPSSTRQAETAHYIAAITKYITLHPGDVIWMGTDGTSPDLVDGDVVEVELTGLGVLRNPFVKAAA